MSDLEFLYVVTAAFYLWECTHWLPNSVVPFVSWYGGKSRTAAPFFVAAGRDAGLVMASPLPGLGTLFMASEWPVAVSPLGVANHSGAIVRFIDQPRFAVRRLRLMAGDQAIARMTSLSTGSRLAKELNHLTAVPEARRESMIRDALAESLSVEKVAVRHEEFKQASWLPRITAALLWMFAFIGAPTVIWRSGLEKTWPWLVGGLVALCGLNAIVFFRAHRRLHPKLDDARFTHLLMVLLFPPAGMRSLDALSRPLMERFHPLAVARQLSDASQFRVLSSRTVRELRYPRAAAPGVTAEGEAIWSWFNETLCSEVGRFVSKNGISIEESLAAPKRLDAECRSYCPRCLSQFTRTRGTCSDCGLRLVEFS
jgi:hypothetical protein